MAEDGRRQVLLNGLVFASTFDAGNLQSVVYDAARSEYVVTAAPDPAPTPSPTTCIALRVRNLVRHVALYDQDMRPVTRALPSQRKWERLHTSVGMTPSDPDFSITFGLSAPTAGDVVYVAFTYPYAYADLQRSLRRLDADMAARDDLYYCRETLVTSLDGRNVDLLTLSSRRHLVDAREPSVPDLFPDHDAISAPRPRRFQNKRVVVLTARVHPAETPSSYVVDGVLAFLCKRDDPRVAALLDAFVFKIIPMLNPDGVARGYYRHDTLGQNLNRFYDAPSLEAQPTIYGVRHWFLSLCDSEAAPSVYIDLHAHAAKRGCFIYGNRLETIDAQVATQLFPKLVGLNSTHFEYDQCTFTAENMVMVEKRDGGLSKQGCARVALYNATKAMHPSLHFYTLECNYNSGRKPGRVPPTGAWAPRGIKASGPLSPDVATRSYLPKYTPAAWADVGKGLMLGLLDLYSLNPCSRLPQSSWRTLAGVVQETRRQVAPTFIKTPASASSVVEKRKGSSNQDETSTQVRSIKSAPGAVRLQKPLLRLQSTSK
ncbi:hypothetical protein SPRG_01956 [Saprolegnia parasitica CBS 223.65]|uniref:tubulin-glutamate carboxypeptidase n=1 Tax=Saprolegnia parasitica (strain CBS 223.65) TaxID=695850 RepID=A0A067CR18_SAPPC|nr:hypothetical protein SPRG_01956 [Saprolegnia parasitica CBS 223.65]KDO33144.1 hypothetical protein SPRG_01956 [Saprolegnia parasitica CBS 223.65]|eukprot:XP_012195909.1 hypothetical protein SPRG_01956 [Saprolegnia parasitica CBS 223.65]